MRKLLKKNLIVLQYSPNTCYTQVVDKIPEEIEINLETRFWTYKNVLHNSSDWMTRSRIGFKIGSESRQCNFGCRGGVIGVYDRTNLQHLNAMLHAASEATSDLSSELDD